MQEFKQLGLEIGDINQRKAGKLRLEVPPMVGMQIAGSVSAFRQRYPGMALNIVESGG